MTHGFDINMKGLTWNYLTVFNINLNLLDNSSNIWYVDHRAINFIIDEVFRYKNHGLW